MSAELIQRVVKVKHNLLFLELPFGTVQGAVELPSMEKQKAEELIDLISDDEDNNDKPQPESRASSKSE